MQQVCVEWEKVGCGYPIKIYWATFQSTHTAFQRYESPKREREQYMKIQNSLFLGTVASLIAIGGFGCNNNSPSSGLDLHEYSGSDRTCFRGITRAALFQLLIKSGIVFADYARRFCFEFGSAGTKRANQLGLREFESD
jgi:hypothetical protein